MYWGDHRNRTESFAFTARCAAVTPRSPCKWRPSSVSSGALRRFKPALSPDQLEGLGETCRDRTGDLRIDNPLLCRSANVHRIGTPGENQTPALTVRNRALSFTELQGAPDRIRTCTDGLPGHYSRPRCDWKRASLQSRRRTLLVHPQPCSPTRSRIRLRS